MKKTVIEFIRGITDGGAETLVKDYCILIDREKYNIIVVVLFAKKESANYRALREAGIQIIELYNSWNFINRLKYKVFGKFYIPTMLNRIVKKYNPIALHIHMTVLRFVAPISKRLKDLNLFYTCHSVVDRYLGKEQMGEQRAAKRLIKNNNLILIGLTESMVEDLNNLFNVTNSIVVRNGIDFERYKFTDDKLERRRYLGIPENAFLVGHVGRFHPLKNHEFLVTVFEEISKLRSDAFLLMVGHGEEKEHIINILHQKNLDDKYLILSNRNDVPQLLKVMDVFVFCSKVEGFGMVAIEAQLAGVRCLISNTVPADTHVTDLAIPLNLNESAKYWAEVALNPSIIGHGNGKLSFYNMRREIKVLEQLYSNGTFEKES